VTAFSPELVVGAAGAEVVSKETALNSQPLATSLLVLARLGCLKTLVESPAGLNSSLAVSIRSELLNSLSWSRLSLLGSWFSYSHFSRRIVDELDEGRRDVLATEFVLSQVSLEELLRSRQSWPALRLRIVEKASAAGVLHGREAGLATLLEKTFMQQRDALVKELLLKSLPTLVLLVSAAIAIVMALVFWRSLMTGG